MLTADTAADSERLGRALAAAAAGLPRLAIALEGDLGSGKTTLARAFLRAAGVEGRIKSPTYALVEPYELADGRSAWHLDLYRIGSARELEHAGIVDLLHQPGVALIEWPERGAPLLPPADLRLRLEAPAVGGAEAAEHRRITLEACGEPGRRLLSELRRRCCEAEP